LPKPATFARFSKTPKKQLAMKKLFAILTVAAVMAACNNAPETAAKSADSAALKAADTAKAAMDTAKAAMDTAKAALDTAKAKIDTAAKKK
jgi:hypothetical protein